jgi:type IV pilus assembly protein PilA
MKKMDNKGFSLIELIIVIAIMAILVAIIAPNLTKYLGSSKEETDKKNLDEVVAQVKNCISDASIQEIAVTPGSYTYNGTTCTGASNSFGALVATALDGASAKSKVNPNKTTIQITISSNGNGGFNVTAAFS